nr:glycosyltransferase family 4 protein [Robiginitalea marina]
MGSKVHENLYSHLAQESVKQTLYYPLRKHAHSKVEAWESPLKRQMVFSGVLKEYHRIFFRQKIKFLFRDIQSKVSLTDFTLVHATTLFSDGALALKIFRKYRIPYIVAVRGTDINLFLKYRKDLNSLAREILREAKQVVFISESLRNNFFSTPLIQKLEGELKGKCRVIPNGLDAYWIENANPRKKQTPPTNILYIGKFNTNKNVLLLLQAFLSLKENFPELRINLVGKGGSQEPEIKKLAREHKESITFHGPIYDQEKLRQMFRENHIFAMVSKGETFGLVYVEALTQGLPIVFTQNQGIDGTFKEKVGEAADPRSKESIKKGLQAVVENYPEYHTENLDFSRFSWPLIAKQYMDLYKDATSK